MRAGVHGIITGGSTGEHYAQSLDERQELAALAKDTIGGRTALVVGTDAIRRDESIRMAEAAALIGAYAILIGSPPHAVPTERENALNALAIDRTADLPGDALRTRHLCLNRNGVSGMRQLDDGLWSACVCNGLGTARSTRTGIGAAELASGSRAT